MDSGTALVLLRKKLTFQASEEDDEASVRNLGCIHLAITQAAAFIDRRHLRMTVLQYVQGLQRDDRERTRLLELDVREPQRDREQSNSIINTWYMSFEGIRHARPSAAQFLAFMSCFEGLPGQRG